MRTIGDLKQLLEQTETVRDRFPMYEMMECLRCFRVGTAWVASLDEDQIATIGRAKVDDIAAKMDDELTERYLYIGNLIEDNCDDLEAIYDEPLTKIEWVFFANIFQREAQHSMRGEYSYRITPNAIDRECMRAEFKKAAVYQGLADTIYGWAIEAPEKL